MGRGGWPLRSSLRVEGRGGGWNFSVDTCVSWALWCCGLVSVGWGDQAQLKGGGPPRGQRLRGAGFFLPSLPVSDPRGLLLTFLSVAFAMASWLWPAVRILWSLRSLPPVWLQGSG